MIDFNNPFLALQQRQGILSSVARGHKTVQLTELNAAEAVISFGSYWNIQICDLCDLNGKAKEKLNTMFLLDLDLLRTLTSDTPVVLLESDRVEKGEWDNFEGKWVTAGYQHVLVMGCIDWFDSTANMDSQSLDCKSESVLEMKWEYPETTFSSLDKWNIFPLGLLDIPLDELVAYENQRVYGELLSLELTKTYERTLHQVLRKYYATDQKRNSKELYRSQKRGFGH